MLAGRRLLKALARVVLALSLAWTAPAAAAEAPRDVAALTVAVTRGAARKVSAPRNARQVAVAPAKPSAVSFEQAAPAAARVYQRALERSTAATPLYLWHCALLC